MPQLHDFAVIGAGMAGASIAAELAPQSSVIVLEGENQPGYHATGRSAAFWEACYGGPNILPLTMASHQFLNDGGFLNRRGALYIGREDQRASLDGFMARFTDTGAAMQRIGRQELDRMIPGLRPQWTGAIWEEACADIDVAALHAHYLRNARNGGATLLNDAHVQSLERHDDAWTIGLRDGRTVQAATIVNAAGAWVDELAILAGAPPIGITPLRRTVVQLRVTPMPPPDMPLVLDIDGGFYFKPEAGSLWLSPHDETPSPPCDAAPEELAVAQAIESLATVVEWKVDRVEHRWAGLRSFAPDRRPVYGYDPCCEGLFWFAGQGGFGIQTAPAAARLAAQIALGLPRDDMTVVLDAGLYSPGRFDRSQVDLAVSA